MNLFAVRVELHHDKQPKDYETLHQILYDVAFYRCIQLKGGKWGDLPHAEYVHRTENSLEQVRIMLELLIRLTLKIKPANSATRKEESFSLSVIQVQPDSSGGYDAWYNLYSSTKDSPLPPGATL